jgi:membrane dipeptidase
MRSDYFGRVSSKGLENVSRFPHLVAELVRPGFYERYIAKMTAGNMRCVLRWVEAIGGQLRKARGVIVQSLG